MSRKPSFKTFRLCLLSVFVITVLFTLIHSHSASAQESADTLMEKAMAAGRAKDFPGVVSFVDQALKLDPQNKRAWLFKGHAYVNMGEMRKAVSSFEKYLKLAPNDEKVKAYLAQLKTKVAKAEPEPAPKPEISPEQYLRNYAGNPNIVKAEAILKAVADRIMEIEKSDPNPQKTLETTWKPHVDTLKKDLLPKIREAARLCKAVAPETEQLVEVHQAYLEAIEKTEAAMQDWVKAIETNNSALFGQGLAKAADGGAKRRQAIEKVNKLAFQIAPSKAPGSSQTLINVTGTYVAKNGESTTLKQTGKRVTGTYQNGQSVIEGELSGTVLKGRFGYRRKVANTGALTFTFSEDGNSFKGKWVNGVNGNPHLGWADSGVLVKSVTDDSKEPASQAADTGRAANFIKSLGNTINEKALGEDRSVFMFNNQEQGAAVFNAQKGTYKGKECYHLTLTIDGSLFGGKVTLKMEGEAYVLPDLTTLKSRLKNTMQMGTKKKEEEGTAVEFKNGLYHHVKIKNGKQKTWTVKARPGLVAEGAEDFVPRLLALRGKPGESITFLRSAEGGKLEKLRFTVKGAKTVKIKAGEFTGIEVAKKILDAGKDTKVKSESWVFSSEGRMLFSKAGDEPFWLEKGTGTETKTAGPAKASEAVGAVIKYITAMTKKDRNALKGLLDMDAIFEFYKKTGTGKREMQKMDAKQMKQFRGIFPLIVLRRLTDHKPGENEELGLAILTDPSVWEEEESGKGETTVRLIKAMRDADPVLAAISFRVKPVGNKWLITHMPGMESKLAATASK